MLSYDISERSGIPLYEQLYQRIRHDVAHGIIAPGEKLPSKRSLAKHLGISVITVEGAYNQLVAEGYVIARQRSGYYAGDLAPAAQGDLASGMRGCFAPVAAYREEKPGQSFNETNEGADAGRSTAPAVPQKPRSAETNAPILADLTRSSAATALFPYATWAKAMREALSSETAETLAQAASAAGSLRLRQAIAHHLRATRGMDVHARQIVVGAGSQTLYQLIIQLLGRHRRYAVEDPGYPLLARMYRSNNAVISLIPLDDQGISMAALRDGGASVAHIMPSHQFPTGIITSAARRRELLNWARDNAGAPKGRFIIEDDYDSEFRMAGRPVPTLFSIDAAARVLYVNSFAKTLGDAFRLAYLVLPERLTDDFEQQLGFYSNTVSPIDQLALARLIESGRYERHVNRLRTKARQSQNALVDALRESPLGDRVAFQGLDGGLHFLLSVESERSETELERAALREGVRLTPLGALRRAEQQDGPPRFVIRFDSVQPDEAPAIADALAKAFS